MITTIIVVSSIVLAVLFTAAWVAKPGLRRRIEEPKHLFANQVRQYDNRNRDSARATGAQSNDDS